MVTRWYRAPEVILNASEYTKAVDIWSVGCILGELLGRTALFPGENYLDQIQRIISVLGTPSYDDISYITNEQALKFIKSLPKRSKQSFEKLFSKANPLALDLLENMLTFNPHDRYTVEDCLSHPYFAGRVIRSAQPRRGARVRRAGRLEFRRLQVDEGQAEGSDLQGVVKISFGLSGRGRPVGRAREQ